MSDKNIDKDIKILKNMKKLYTIKYETALEYCLDGGLKADFLKERVQAIENVLTELEEGNKIRADLYLDNVSKKFEIEKLKQELETYKKIAEKLAEELEKCSLDNKEGLLDWARKEVENEN